MWSSFCFRDVRLSALLPTGHNRHLIFAIINTSDGNDRVIVYLEKEKAVKKMPLSMTIKADSAMIGRLMELSGEKNVKVVEKSIEK